MAIKVAGNTMISDTYELQNIANTDTITKNTINSAIRFQGNVLRIFDSQGTEVRTLYCGRD